MYAVQLAGPCVDRLPRTDPLPHIHPPAPLALGLGRIHGRMRTTSPDGVDLLLAKTDHGNLDCPLIPRADGAGEAAAIGPDVWQLGVADRSAVHVEPCSCRLWATMREGSVDGMSTNALSLVQVQCFVCVVETGSFVEAGRRLGLSTSGVSKTITRLEEARGVRLLNRSTHSLSLTPEGEDLIGLARDAARSIENFDAALTASAREGAQGRVRVGAPTAFVRSCLAPLMPAFRVEHPDINLDLRGSDHVIDLAESAVDITLRSGPVDGIPGHLQRALFRFSWVACATPEYLRRRGTPKAPADLADHDLIGFRNQRTGLLDVWRFGGASDGRPETRWSPDAALILDDANAIGAAVAAGAGIAWAPRWLVADALRAGALRPVLDDHACALTTMSMVRRNHAQSPARLMKVMTFLQDRAPTFAS